jgi:hypothetical protein
MIPIRMSFEDSSHIDVYTVVIDTFSDLYFLIDILITFLIPIRSFEGNNTDITLLKLLTNTIIFPYSYYFVGAF